MLMGSYNRDTEKVNIFASLSLTLSHVKSVKYVAATNGLLN